MYFLDLGLTHEEKGVGVIFIIRYTDINFFGHCPFLLLWVYIYTFTYMYEKNQATALTIFI